MVCETEAKDIPVDARPVLLQTENNNFNKDRPNSFTYLAEKMLYQYSILSPIYFATNYLYHQYPDLSYLGTIFFPNKQLKIDGS